MRLRIPPPTGVVSGPLIPTRCDRNASTVSSGSHWPGLVERLLPGEDLEPVDLARPAVGLVDGGVEHPHRGRPDVGADPVTLDEGQDRLVGHAQSAGSHGDLVGHWQSSGGSGSGAEGSGGGTTAARLLEGGDGHHQHGQEGGGEAEEHPGDQPPATMAVPCRAEPSSQRAPRPAPIMATINGTAMWSMNRSPKRPATNPVVNPARDRWRGHGSSTARRPAVAASPRLRCVVGHVALAPGGELHGVGQQQRRWSSGRRPRGPG